ERGGRHQAQSVGRVRDPKVEVVGAAVVRAARDPQRRLADAALSPASDGIDEPARVRDHDAARDAAGAGGVRRRTGAVVHLRMLQILKPTTTASATSAAITIHLTGPSSAEPTAVLTILPGSDARKSM